MSGVCKRIFPIIAALASLVLSPRAMADYEECLGNCAETFESCRGTQIACALQERQCEAACHPDPPPLTPTPSPEPSPPPDPDGSLRAQSLFWLYKNFDTLDQKHSGKLTKAQLRSEIIKMRKQ